jgi:hypothetical protein
MQDLRWWKFKSCSLPFWRHIVMWYDTIVLENGAVYIFKDYNFKKQKLIT